MKVIISTESFGFHPSISLLCCHDTDKVSPHHYLVFNAKSGSMGLTPTLESWSCQSALLLALEKVNSLAKQDGQTVPYTENKVN